MNYQKLGRELMTQDEILNMDRDKCILQISGVRPFLSKKYDLNRHPNYQQLADADPKKIFNTQAYLVRTREGMPIKKQYSFKIYETNF